MTRIRFKLILTSSPNSFHIHFSTIGAFQSINIDFVKSMWIVLFFIGQEFPMALLFLHKTPILVSLNTLIKNCFFPYIHARCPFFTPLLLFSFTPIYILPQLKISGLNWLFRWTVSSICIWSAFWAGQQYFWIS